MRNIKPTTIAFGLLSALVLNPACAHPGHDHSSWSSSLVHGLGLAAAAGLIILAAFYALRFAAKHK